MMNTYFPNLLILRKLRLFRKIFCQQRQPPRAIRYRVSECDPQTPPHSYRTNSCIGDVSVCVCVCSHTLRGVGSCLTVEVSGQLDPPLVQSALQPPGERLGPQGVRDQGPEKELKGRRGSQGPTGGQRAQGAGPPQGDRSEPGRQEARSEMVL